MKPLNKLSHQLVSAFHPIYLIDDLEVIQCNNENVYIFRMLIKLIKFIQKCLSVEGSGYLIGKIELILRREVHNIYAKCSSHTCKKIMREEHLYHNRKGTRGNHHHKMNKFAVQFLFPADCKNK